MHIRHIISHHETQARESLDLTLQSIIKNVSRADVNFSTLDKKVNEYDPEVNKLYYFILNYICTIDCYDLLNKYRLQTNH